MWMYGSRGFKGRKVRDECKGNRSVFGHFTSQTCQLMGCVLGSEEGRSSRVCWILWYVPLADVKSAQAHLLTPPHPVLPTC